MSEILIRYVKQYAEADVGGISYVETDWDEGKPVHRVHAPLRGLPPWANNNTPLRG